jgi:hypothetical protein
MVFDLAALDRARAGEAGPQGRLFHSAADA